MIHVFCNLGEDEDGHLPFCDMTFEITEKTFDEASRSWNLVCQADARPAGVVGFGASIPLGDWREQVDGEGEDAFHSYWGQVALRSLGTDSDRLIELMADYYGLPPENGNAPGLLDKLRVKAAKGRVFVPKIDCLAVGIASDPKAIDADAVRMKLFFDEGREGGRYAEVFLNVDLQEGFATLNEKDEEYRSDLIFWLSRSGHVNANPYAVSGGIQ